MGSLGLVPHSLSPKNNGGGLGVPRPANGLRVSFDRGAGETGPGQPADLKGYNERSQNKSQIYGRYTRPCIPGPTILSTVPPLSGLNFPPLSQQRKYLPIYCPKLSCSYYIRLVIVEIYIQG